MEYTIPLPLTSVVCVLLFIHGYESTCEVNGKIYEVGETWQEAEDCFQHTCQEDGTHTTSKCDPIHNDVDVVDIVEDTTVDFLEIEKALTTTATEVVQDNQEVVTGCMLDGRVVEIGEQVDVPDRCYYRACAGNDQWLMKACGLIGLAPGWIVTPEDVTKTYPECCGRAAPLLDIIPDVIQSLQWSVALKLTYDNNTVDYGNELTPTQVKAEPTVSFWAEPDSWSMLSMVDPDAPSHENTTSGEFLHWLVGNIPGNNISSGEILAEYVGSGPPQGTNLHRYVFLLYKQPGNLTFEEPILNSTSIEGRRNFSISKFSQNYNLSDPIALNFFIAKYDEYVPEVQKQLGLID